MAPKGRDPKPDTPDRESGLSEEDRALWARIKRDTEPLKRKPPQRPETPREAPEEASEEAPEAAPRRGPAAPATRRPPASRPRAAAPPPPKPKPPPSLAHGDIADLDKRSAERMRRGKLPIEGRLDLHGHTQDQARRELAAFLAGAQAAGKRCVIVITGRGDITRGGGVLRTQVPRWLNEPENRARVLAFDYAQPHHGGLGALYVLLRKARA